MTDRDSGDWLCKGVELYELGFDGWSLSERRGGAPGVKGKGGGRRIRRGAIWNMCGMVFTLDPEKLLLVYIYVIKTTRGVFCG